MEKKLIFQFHVINDWETNPIIKLHLKLLEYYANSFDEVYFVISSNDIINKDTIIKIEQTLINIGYKNVEFHIMEGDYMIIKNKVFYDKFVTGIVEYDGILYFATTEGVLEYNEGRGDYDSISSLICTSYLWTFDSEIYQLATGFGASYAITPLPKIDPDTNIWECTTAFFCINCPLTKNMFSFRNVNPIPEDSEEHNCNYYLSKRIRVEFVIPKAYSLYGKLDSIKDFRHHLNIILDGKDEELNKVNEFIKKMAENFGN